MSIDYDRIRTLATGGDAAAATALLREALRRGDAPEAHHAVDIILGYSRPFFLKVTVTDTSGLTRDALDALREGADELAKEIGARAALVSWGRVEVDLMPMPRGDGDD